MEALLEGLNEAQRSAVTSPAPVVQVLAPPGSGKTKTLTARVAYLINHERLQPWNIIVCTFTIKAAREMRERIRGFVGEGIESKLILGTFHSVARRFLFRYGHEIGLPKNFGIADSKESASIITRIIQRQQFSVVPGHARGRISKLKAKGVSADEYAATQKKADQQEFSCVYAEYQEHLRGQSLLDYDDLLVQCVELLRKHPACVSSIQAVLIDEYQDTNNIQYELMKLMAQYQRRITIVGDPDQSIYGFRSAEIKNLLRMRDDFPQSIVAHLEKNYRSSDCIIKTAKAVIEQDDSRPNKPLLATLCAGELPTLRHLATAHIEAKWIVEEIHRTKTLTAGLLNYGDYSILLRSAALSLSIERELGKAGVPYRMVGGTRFFDRVEIKIVLDYLRVINQPDYNEALTRVINLPSRSIGENTIKALLEEAEKKRITLWKLVLDCAQGTRRPECRISAPAQRGIDTFVNVILTSRLKFFPKDGEGCSLVELISHILQKISLLAHLKHVYKDNWEDRWANVEELVIQATQVATSLSNGEEITDDILPVVEGIEQREDTAADTLSKFLANVALSTEIEKEDGEKSSQVTISTIHAAKGLEWPVVFIPAVFDGSIPHSKADDHDEERRLLYVGMTRAQALLYLSCPVRQSRQENDTTLSKFISQRSIQKLFNHNGPTIGCPTHGCTVLRDLAQILRRPCPDIAEIEAARVLLEYPEDVRYPFTREAMDGEESWNTSDVSNYGPGQQKKRRRLEASSSSLSGTAVSVTINNSANFSVAKTTLKPSNAGFTSARDLGDLRKMQEEAEAIRTLAMAKTAASSKVAYQEAKKADLKTAPTKKAKPRPAGQGSITNFFTRAKTTMTEAVPPARVPAPKRSSSLLEDSPLADISNIQAQRVQTHPYQPASISNYKVQTTRIPTKPKKECVLLSSSPAKGDSPCSKPLSEGNTAEEPQSPTKTICPSFTSTAGFYPASTLHTTSMSQLQNQSSGPQRKTLGFTREFKNSGSDLIVKEDLAKVLGCGRIQDQLARFVELFPRCIFIDVSPIPFY
ncbi:P-loop containing nucleoside triphosphate hydrolase protein [Massarina eburnea CBS 473.64]|uniref:DNA 3'-5' helicase n=1 Tax=Massarina eburnea CBS 473.64 TaxID=1395130 RepID=A0A6A6S827_9PLEO|nr:P-loop containing nucleoside triphosphate hydrolase protein [Massarina eburnea CBS 473.64]